jgi:hypothetical protein
MTAWCRRQHNVAVPMPSRHGGSHRFSTETGARTAVTQPVVREAFRNHTGDSNMSVTAPMANSPHSYAQCPFRWCTESIANKRGLRLAIRSASVHLLSSAMKELAASDKIPRSTQGS